MVARCSKTPNPDRMLHHVQCRFRDGLFWAERQAHHMDRATTIDYIRSGNLSEVVTVLECNPVEGTCRDVTDDILAAVEQARIERDPPTLEDSLNRMRGMLIDHERDLVRDGLYGWTS